MARRRQVPAGKAKGLQDNQASEGPETAPGGRSPDTAEGEPPPEDVSGKDPKTLFWDPFAIVEQLGFRDRPSSVTYQTLKSIVWRTPIVRAIIQTRLNQMAAFCQPQRDRFHLGFRVRTREEAHEPTKEDRKWIKQAESLIMRTGATESPRGRDSFETFLRKVMLDSLTLDQMVFEVVPDRKGRPCEWYAVDGSTIRLADSASTYLHVDLEDDVRYVQIYDGMIINEYTNRDMAFCIRNPSTDVRLFGYGTCELEMLVEAITSFLYAWEYNTRFFRQGSAMKGLINLKGTVPDDKLRAFRRHWYTMVSGVENAWRTPILNTEDVQWLPMQTSNRDMEFGAWMDFLIKVVCSAYSIDPVEVNFQYGNQGQKSALSQQSNREKITESKERGLRPLLRFLASAINRHIIWPWNESFEFEFTGLDAMTRDQWATYNKSRVSTTMMVDEIRAEEDRPPLPDGMGKVLLDASWMQMKQAMDAQKQQQAMGGQQPGVSGQGPPGQEQGQPEEGQGQDPEQQGGPEDQGQDPGVFDEEQLAQQLGGGGPQGFAKSFGPGPMVIDVEI